MNLLGLARIYVGFWLAFTPLCMALAVWLGWKISQQLGGVAWHLRQAMFALFCCIGAAVLLPVIALLTAFALGL